ncbi:MAG: EAL domain-containing protein [Cyanobacteria bacterium J06635_15]
MNEARFRTIFDHTFQFIGLLEPDGTLIEINQSALDFAGLQREQVIGQPFWQTPWWRLSTDSQAQLRESIAQVDLVQFIRYEVEVCGTYNQVITLDFSLRPILDGSGQATLIIVEGHDVSDRKQVEVELRESQKHYASLAAASPVGIFRTDAQGDCLYVNEKWCSIAGMSPEAAHGQGWSEAIHPDDRARVFEEWYQATQTNQPFQAEYRFRTPTGTITWVFGQAVAERDDTGNITGYVGTITDITERKQLEVALAEEKELAQVTLHSIGDAVITTDAAGKVRYLNPVAETLTGWTAQEAQGRLILEVFQIINEATRAPAINPIDRVLAEGIVTGLANHTILIRRDGQEFSIEDSAAPIRDSNYQLIGVVMVFHDVTLARHLAQKMSWQATHDGLTKLHNRRYFEDKLKLMVKTAIQQDQQHALCYLDLDQFKVVNDTCGHLAGDELLRQVAKILQQHIRTVDILARLGGDEFGILLDQCPIDQALQIAEAIRQTLADYQFVWQDQTFGIGVTIGLVAIDCNSLNATEVLSAADVACYAAKYRGRNRVQVYQKDDAELTQQRQEHHWIIRIRQALEANRFCLYRQLIAQTHTPDASGNHHYEVLVRMLDGSGKLISPAIFIPAAERYGLMPMLDRWIVHTCFSNLERTLNGSSTDVLHGINLSGTSLDDERFLDFLKAQFSNFRVPPQSIYFEITETAAIADFAKATSFIQELKQLGCRFALDDFGSGMASFAYLEALPVDFLKIDGKFIQNMTVTPTTQAIVESIHRVGNVMGLQTIAESVENTRTLETLQTIGVDFVQGYRVSHPVPWCSSHGL